MTSDATEILTLREVEKLLKVSYATVYRMRRRGDLTGYRVGRSLYFRRSEIMATMTANRVQITPAETQQAA